MSIRFLSQTGYCSLSAYYSTQSFYYVLIHVLLEQSNEATQSSFTALLGPIQQVHPLLILCLP